MEASDIFMILLSTLQQLFTHSKTASYCAQMADHIFGFKQWNTFDQTLLFQSYYLNLNLDFEPWNATVVLWQNLLSHGALAASCQNPWFDQEQPFLMTVHGSIPNGNLATKWDIT